MKDITQFTAISEETSVAVGYFDGLHLGHIQVICAALKDTSLKSVVFTFSADSVLPKRGGDSENILPFFIKEDYIRKIGVDYLFAPAFESIKDLTPAEFVKTVILERLNAKKVFCGYDFRFGKNGAGDVETLKTLCGEYGIQVTVIPPYCMDGEPVSSTRIRALIKKGDIVNANRYLGYDLAYRLPVIHGQMLGRQLDAPTINQLFPKGTVIPAFGVYVSKTEVQGKFYPSITNIGVKPTVTDEKVPLMETYIIGFSGDLYGQDITVSLQRFLRSEMKFTSLDALKEQIKKDIEIATEEG